MKYLDLFIVNCAFNDSYENGATFIDFIIQDTVINSIIEGINWSICATFLLSIKPIILSATLLNRYSYDIIFQ